jgi:hypothetical protein
MRHGQELENFWQGTYGYNLDCFPEVEGGRLARQSPIDKIRGRLEVVPTVVEFDRLTDAGTPEVPAAREELIGHGTVFEITGIRDVCSKAVAETAEKGPASCLA